MKQLTVAKAYFYTLKGTWAVRTAILAPCIIICLRLLLILFDGDTNFRRRAWDNFLNGNFAFWFGLFFPVIVSLICALVVDHDKQMKTLLFSLPIKRGNYFLTKLMMAFAMVASSSLLLLGSSVLVGELLFILKPEAGFSAAIPHLGTYIQMVICCCLASIIQMALSLWVSTRSSTFVVALSIGLTGSLVNLVGIQVVVVQ